MPLEKVFVPVDIAGGIDTKTDEKLTDLPTEVINGRYSVGKSITKRLGYSKLSDRIAGSATLLTSGDGMASYQDELLAFADNKLYSYSSTSGNEQWVDKGSYLSLKVDSTDIVRNTSEARNQDSCVASNLILYAWESYSVAAALEGVYISVIDATSGAVLQNQTLIDATAIRPRCIALSGVPTLAYLDTSASPHHIKTVQVNLADPTTNDAAKTVVSGGVKASAPHWDTSVFFDDPDNGAAVFAFNNNSSNTISVGFINSDGNVGSSTNGWPAVTNFTSTNAEDGITIHVDQHNTTNATKERIYVAYWANSGSEGLKFKRLTRYLVAEATVTAEASGTLINSCSLLVDSATLDLNLFWTFNATNTFDQYIKTGVYDISGTSMGSASVFKRSVGLASKAWEYNSRIYLMVCHASTLQTTYFALEATAGSNSGLILAKMLPGTSGGLPAAPIIPAITQPTSGNFEFGGLVKTRLESRDNDIFTLAGISRMQLDFTSVERFESAELGESLLIGGGFLSLYDSEVITEHGFHLGVHDLSAAVNNSAGSLAAGTYSYKCIYTWIDAKGIIYRSTPSLAVSATTSGGSSTVTLTVPTLRLSNKTGVIIETYRTEDSGTIYYRVDRTANNSAADSVSVADAGAISDANLITKEILYTAGGVLENVSPPAALVLGSFANRMFVVSSENPKKLVYSKTRLPKKAIDFSDLFEIVLNKAERITALAEMDSKLIIMEPDSIWYITGNGPNSTGQQDDFSPPKLVTRDVGCNNTNSLVMSPLGLMFQSKKGIYLLDRSLQTAYVGAPVEAFNALTITSAELIEDENQIRYLTNDGSALIYDYYFGKWCTWDNHTGVGATIWSANSSYVYFRTDGRIFEQSATSYMDDNDPIEMTITTAWIKTKGIQAFQRVRSAFVLGEWRSDHKLMIQAAYNYKPYFSESHVWDYLSDLGVDEYGDATPYGDQSPYGSGTEGIADGVYQFKAHLKYQKNESMRFKIKDIEETAPGQAYSISSLMLEVGLRNNAMKLPKQRRV